MNRRVVERVFSLNDAQKTGALREGGLTESGHLQKFFAAVKAAVFVAEGDDVFCYAGIDA